MSFAAEMKDFFNAFETTSSTAGKIRERRDERKANLGLEDFAKGYEGPNALDSSSYGPGKNKKKGKREIPSSIKNIIDRNVPEKYRDYAYRMAEKESAFDANATSPTGAHGLFQFTKGTGKQYGLIGPQGDARANPELNTKAFVRLTEDNAKGLRSALGREPTAGELALAHQQGLGGATYLLTGRAPKGLNVKQVEANLAANNIKARGRDAANAVSNYYGFSLGSEEAGSSREPASYASALPVEDSEYSDPVPQRAEKADSAPKDEEDKSAFWDEFYNNDGIDVAALDVPAPKRYVPGDMTESPSASAYMATGGSVPWAGQTSQIRRVPSQMGRYVARRPYTPRFSTTQEPAAKKESTPQYPWADTMEYITKYQQQYSPSYVNWVNQTHPYVEGSDNSGRNGAFTYGGKFFNDFVNNFTGRKLYADGGAVEGEPPEEAAVHQEEAIPTQPQAMGYSERNKPMRQESAGSGGKVTLPKVLDLALKYLSHSNGLNKASAAVGNDPALQHNRKRFLAGSMGNGEPPPSPEEMKQVFQTVDPNGELNDSLRTIYAMRKGVEFYMTRGEVDKAAKWASGLVQYSNLVSRQYGVEAVQAGKAGDMDSMVQLAVKAYDAIPDGMNVQAKLNGGEVSVTRTDEEGNVVDTHKLTPQQVFQMATGISQGSGYFEALMEVADPGSDSERSKKADGITRAGNLNKLLPDIKEDLELGEQEAWSAAVESGDAETLNKILSAVQQRRKERISDERYDQRQADIDRRIEAARKASEEALDKRLSASEAAAEKRLSASEAAAEKRLTASEERAEKARKASEDKAFAERKMEVESMSGLLSDYEADMTASEKKQWELGTNPDNPNPDALKKVMSNIDKRREQKRSDERFEQQGSRIEERAATSFQQWQQKFEAQQTANAEGEQRRAKLAADEQAAKDKVKADKDLAERQAAVDELDGLFESYESYMTAGQKTAWERAKKNANPDRMEEIIKAIDDTGFGPTPESEAAAAESAIPVNPETGNSQNWLTRARNALLTPWQQSAQEAVPTSPDVTAGSNPMPPDAVQAYRKAIAAAKGDRVKINAIRERTLRWAQNKGYSTEGL